MLSLHVCYCEMDPQQFKELPNSTNAVESHNRFGRPANPLPLKAAMLETYREDMTKSLQIIANRRGLSTTYENPSEDARCRRSAQQNKARRKRFRSQKNEDPEGPPDTKHTFNPGTCTCRCTTALIFLAWVLLR